MSYANWQISAFYGRMTRLHTMRGVTSKPPFEALDVTLGRKRAVARRLAWKRISLEFLGRYIKRSANKWMSVR
jgi:hypothetical protein